MTTENFEEVGRDMIRTILVYTGLTFLLSWSISMENKKKENRLTFQQC